MNNSPCVLPLHFVTFCFNQHIHFSTFSKHKNIFAIFFSFKLQMDIKSSGHPADFISPLPLTFPSSLCNWFCFPLPSLHKLTVYFHTILFLLHVHSYFSCNLLHPTILFLSHLELVTACQPIIADHPA